MADPYRLGSFQRRLFSEGGYLVVPELATADELHGLSEVWDELFERHARVGSDRYIDVSVPDPSGLERRSIQVLFPERDMPELAESPIIDRARDVAAVLLEQERDALTWESQMMQRPAKVGADTGWHQDVNYVKAEYQQSSLTIWLALDDVDPDGSCMKFVVGSHLDAPYRYDRNGALIDAVNPRRVALCPLKGGSATVHHVRTLHATGTNDSSRTRRAWINVFSFASH
jgi:hypothetical protein